MIEAIKNHKSIRNYKKDQIPDSILTQVLEAASRASTTGNMQLYSIVVTKNEEIKEELWPLHFKQNMIKEAPVVLTFCADINRFNKWCDLRNAEHGYDNFLFFMTAAIDALLAAQNACLEAEANDLGICYLGTTLYMAEPIIKVLNLPKGVIPITTVVLGYPADNPGLTDRLPLEAIIHQETYHDYKTEDIENIFSVKENMDFYKGIVKENEVENLAQVFTIKRYKKADNEHFSKLLMNVLQKQGFLK